MQCYSCARAEGTRRLVRAETLYPRGKSPRRTLNRRLCETRSGLDALEEKKSLEPRLVV